MAYTSRETHQIISTAHRSLILFYNNYIVPRFRELYWEQGTERGIQHFVLKNCIPVHLILELSFAGEMLAYFYLYAFHLIFSEVSGAASED